MSTRNISNYLKLLRLSNSKRNILRQSKNRKLNNQNKSHEPSLSRYLEIKSSISTTSSRDINFNSQNSNSTQTNRVYVND